MTEPVVLSFAGGGGLVANPMFDGVSDQQLLDPGSEQILEVGDYGVLMFTVIVRNNEETGPFHNSAMASGSDPQSTQVTDRSDDGAIVDANSNGNGGDPGEDDPTTHVLEEVDLYAIPTTSEVGLALLAMLLLAAARRRLGVAGS